MKTYWNKFSEAKTLTGWSTNQQLYIDWPKILRYYLFGYKLLLGKDKNY